MQRFYQNLTVMYEYESNASVEGLGVENCAEGQTKICRLMPFRGRKNCHKSGRLTFYESHHTWYFNCDRINGVI